MPENSTSSATASGNPEKTRVCPLHPKELLLDELGEDRVIPLSLCPECEEVVIVDWVRQLFARRSP